ncbi:MAG TPA: hypothetical protein VG228_05780 [Solirubrobacteraceae bacterium]|jgi:hypothetical protein|nr:hypothetical protein [Solirubrobacteraceae bacterium]
MSFIPPVQPTLANEVAREREHELEHKAAEYAHLHPETDYPIETHPRRLLRRLASALKRPPRQP